MMIADDDDDDIDKDDDDCDESDDNRTLSLWKVASDSEVCTDGGAPALVVSLVLNKKIFICVIRKYISIKSRPLRFELFFYQTKKTRVTFIFSLWRFFWVEA